MCAKKKIQPASPPNGESFEIKNDEFITELMRQRRIQQDALQKIIAFMESEQEILDGLKKQEERKRKFFNTDKKKPT